MSARNSRLAKKIRKSERERRNPSPRSRPFPAEVLGRPLTDDDWQVTHQVIMSLQLPRPLSPEWKAELGPEWPAKARIARAVLLQAQQEQTPVPEHVWDAIDPAARAGFLRNTITGCLQYWDQI